MENKNINTPANMGKRTLSSLIILVVLLAFFLLRQISETTVFLFDIFIGFLMIIGTFEVENLLRKMDRPTYTIGLGLFPVLCFVLLIISVLYQIEIGRASCRERV